MGKKNKPEEPEIELYNEEQQFWANVKENSTSSIEQFEKGIKLAKATIIMAEGKIKESSEKQKI
jgi:hypothetical protein